MDRRRARMLRRVDVASVAPQTPLTFVPRPAGADDRQTCPPRSRGQDGAPGAKRGRTISTAASSRQHQPMLIHEEPTPPITTTREQAGEATGDASSPIAHVPIPADHFGTWPPVHGSCTEDTIGTWNVTTAQFHPLPKRPTPATCGHDNEEHHEPTYLHRDRSRADPRHLAQQRVRSRSPWRDPVDHHRPSHRRVAPRSTNCSATQQRHATTTA